jgi:hypothetical protein
MNPSTMNTQGNSSVNVYNDITNEDQLNRRSDLLLQNEEEDYILSAKSFFDVKEYSRAYKLLEHCQSSKARFICLYSRYLVRRAIADSVLPLISEDGRLANARQCKTGMLSMVVFFLFHILHS